MSRRVFVRVRRGPMDNTAVCVFPWEMNLLQHIHAQEVTEVSIEDMANQRDGVAKVERQKLKKLKNLNAAYAPDLQGQLELMAYVHPDEDPALDAASEYNRLIEKYGMDKEFPMPVVERVYGQFETGSFQKVLAEHAKDRAPMPEALKKILAQAAEEAEALDEVAPKSQRRQRKAA